MTPSPNAVVLEGDLARHTRVPSDRNHVSESATDIHPMQ